MHWYGGSIAEAVTLSKQKNAIFVVFVEGDNDLSAEMAATIDDTAVVSRLSNQTNFLAVKLKSGTTNYTHFAQIYQFVPVPSLFFIGRNGTPLEVVCAGVQPSNLATRIDRILAQHHGEKPPLDQASTSSSSHGIRDATAGLLQAEANASSPVSNPGAARSSEVKSAVPAEAPSPAKFPKSSVPAAVAAADKNSDDKAEYEVVCDGDVCVRRPKAADQPSTSQVPVVTPAVVAPSVITPAATLAATTELERQKELERRNTGQGVAEPKKWQADQEMKQIQEDRKREKLEDNLARQRILEQIAQDRAERRARDNPTPLPTPSPAQQTTSHLATEARSPKPESEAATSQAPVVTPAVVAPSVIAPAATLAATTEDKPPQVTESDTSVDEKLERAKELIEAKRREKAEKEKELERQKELERRNTGQGVAELKKWQADQEMKQIQEDRKREKLENNLARQRILEQIAQDRAERRARDNPAPAPLPTPSPAQQQTTSHLATSGDAGTSARVQFKLPDGSSHTAHFDAAGTLGQVQRYVADNLQLSASSFALWTAFPRRELTDASATLRDLELAPSAALLVLPRRAQTPTAGPTQYFSVYAFISQLLTTYLYQPSVVLYTWIRTRLFPPPAVGPRPPTAPAPPTGVTPTIGVVPRAGVLPRRRTNIHRLPGDSANDDDNNTWNGNSTQQM